MRVRTREASKTYGFYVVDEKPGSRPFGRRGIQEAHRVFAGEFDPRVVRRKSVVFVTSPHAQETLARLFRERVLKQTAQAALGGKGHHVLTVRYVVSGKTVYRKPGDVPFERVTIGRGISADTAREMDLIWRVRSAVTVASLHHFRRKASRQRVQAAFKERSRSGVQARAIPELVERRARKLGDWLIAKHGIPLKPVNPHGQRAEDVPELVAATLQAKSRPL